MVFRRLGDKLWSVTMLCTMYYCNSMACIAVSKRCQNSVWWYIQSHISVAQRWVINYRNLKLLIWIWSNKIEKSYSEKYRPCFIECLCGASVSVSSFLYLPFCIFGSVSSSSSVSVSSGSVSSVQYVLGVVIHHAVITNSGVFQISSDISTEKGFQHRKAPTLDLLCNG